MVHSHDMHGSYDLILVMFSYLVAVVASYTVLDLTGTIVAAERRSRWRWLAYGALAMGLGIWSMHFVGMLAFKLDMPVDYDLRFVLLSVLAAIAASFVALYAVTRPRLRLRELLGGGLLLAAGISTMHYIGMAAMLIGIRYDPALFVLSIVIAIVASIAALWLAFYFRKDAARGQVWKRLGSGLIMGAAIVGMHYTGMYAATFHMAADRSVSSGMSLDPSRLGYFIAGGTLFTLGLSLLGSYISKRMSSKDSEILAQSRQIALQNEELRLLNDHLEEMVRERTAELEKAHDEAIRANLFKSQFLANMSHELRTPLNAIIGYSEMLMEDAAELDDPMFAEDLAKIGKSGKHLLSLINDILDISKIEAGKMEVHIEPCQVQELAADVLTTVTPLAQAGGNRLETEIAAGELEADATKLRQVLINLLSNAAKFTKDGVIRFEAVRQSRGGQDGYTFTVRDTGIGMSPEQMDKLFEPFSQADASTTRKYGGTGLGLAISRRFCEMMGGDITVDSRLGEGSAFTCWLPAKASPLQALSQPLGAYSFADSSPDADTDDAAEAPGQGASVLVIDDEPMHHQLVRRYLEKTGWKLAFAGSGAEGLAMSKRLRPQAIVLDILMPSMDGWSVLSELKSDPDMQSIPVIVLSMTDDRQLGYSLGASEFLTKPVRRERLIEAIGNHLPTAESGPILVVEDDETTSDLFAKLLRKEGYTVLSAVNGRVALDAFERERPGLILLDLMMPEMDGFQFVAELRRRRGGEDVPIVVITAKTITSEEQRRLSGYVRGIMQKGAFDYQSLLADIKTYIKREEGA